MKTKMMAATLLVMAAGAALPHRCFPSSLPRREHNRPRFSSRQKVLAMIFKRAFCVLTLSFFLTAGAQAGVLVSYPLNNSGDGNNGFNYTTFDAAQLEAASIAKGPGLGQYSVGTDSWSGDVQVLKTGPGTAVSGATADTALANDWYFSITLDPIGSMDIRSIEADWSRGALQAIEAGSSARASTASQAISTPTRHPPVRRRAFNAPDSI